MDHIDPDLPIARPHPHLDPRALLLTAVAQGNLQEIDRLLDMALQRGIDVGNVMGTALFSAVHHGHLAVVERLLNRGADPNLRVDGQSVLHLAIVGASSAIVTTLLDRGADIHQRLEMGDVHNATPLMAAALSQPSLVELLLERGAEVDAVDGAGHTALMHAVRAGNDRCVKALALRSGQIDQRSHEGKSAFRYAFENNLNALMRVLVEAGADIDQECPPGSRETALGDAILKGHRNKVQWLIKRGANPNRLLGGGWTPLRHALAAPHGTDMMRLLLRNGANARLGEEQGHSVLAIAAGERNEKAIELLMAHGVDPRRIADRALEPDLPADALEAIRSSALQVATWFGYVDVLEALAEQGFDLITPVSRHNDTALHLAVSRQNHEMVNLLLQNKRAAEWVNARNDFLDTPLMLLQKGDLEMARLLVQRGAHVHVADEEKTTPLLMAVHEGDEQMVGFLLSHGAVCTADRNGRDVLYWAINGSGHDVMSLLQLLSPRIGNDLDINARDAMRRTPLMHAIQAKRLDVVQFLLDAGATIDLEDRAGRTAMDVARATRQPAMVSLLERHSDEPHISSTADVIGDRAGTGAPRQEADRLMGRKRHRDEDDGGDMSRRRR
jgi:ankyrin repeat protein